MTNGEIDKLGEKIGQTAGNVSAEDLQKLQEFRKTFKEPIAEVFDFVSKIANKIDKQSIVTYRIKRIDTIIRKLQRFSENENGSMKLSRMWDIAGCRCILNTNDESKLYQILSAIKKEYGENCKVNDYVLKPKESGYRSIHIYVKDKVYKKSVEIQIRNTQQHNWSTLVEIIDVLFGTKTKEGQKTKNLDEFLKLYSKRETLAREDLVKLITIGRKNRIFEQMSSMFSRNYIRVYQDWVQNRPSGCFYVIEANSNGSTIESYRSFEKAEAEYYNKYLNSKDTNIVLTHIVNADFDRICKAYSNYVLSMHAFFDEYRNFICTQILLCIEKKDRFLLGKLMNIFVRNAVCYIKNINSEISAIELCLNNTKSNRSQIIKWKKSIVRRQISWNNSLNYFGSRLDYNVKKKPLLKLYLNSKFKSISRKIK